MSFNPRDQIRSVASRPLFQPLWASLLKLCHAGMNYGGGQSIRNSGELGALRFAGASFPRDRSVVLFDVGANDGDYIEASRSVLQRSDLRIFSFEPQRSSFDVLASHYGHDPGVTLRHAALGRQRGTVDLFFSEQGESTASLHRAEAAASDQFESVEMTTVDDVCREASLEIIDFLKIDTEGHEIDVILGAQGMIDAGRVTALQFEFGETFLHTSYHFTDIYELLAPRYTIYRILRSGLLEITRYTHDLEVFKLANFLCIRKPSAAPPAR